MKARASAWLLCCIAFGSAAAQPPPAEPSVARHPEETRALTAPADVLAGLPARLEAAQARGDAREEALLRLAESNACRMVVRVPCQAQAAAQAREAAARAGSHDLVVRGYILEASAEIARQDFTRAEQLLIEAQGELRRHPHPLLLGDAMLAYSTISYSLGNEARSEDYAHRGLEALGTTPALTIRIRLLRNLARAQAQQGRYDEAERALEQGLALSPPGEDPRLRAELHTESARLAQQRHDPAAQRMHAEAALAIGLELDNAPVSGGARELLGDAAQAAGDLALAETRFGEAVRDFELASLPRDERRAIRRLIPLLLDRGADPLAEPHVRRLIELDARLEAQDQSAMSANFDARLAQAEQGYAMQLLQQSVQATEQRRVLLRWLIAAGAALLLVLAGVAIAQRRSSKRLAEALARARDNEARYQALTDHMPAAIVELDRELRFRQVNAWLVQRVGQPASEILGRTVREVRGEELGAQWQPYLEATLAGEISHCEVKTIRGGRPVYLDSTFLPRRAPDGSVAGIYALTFDVTQLKLAQEELEQLARIDSLTGIANRRHLDERLAAILAHARRMNRGVAVLALDLDRFKSINDTLGHAAGDAVLREFVARVLRCVRKDDFLARLGGDEFILVVEEPPAVAGEIIARKLLGCMQAPMSVLGTDLQTSVSIGVAFGDGRNSAEQLLAAADEALYEAKAKGRATFAIRHAGAAQPEPPRSAG